MLYNITTPLPVSQNLVCLFVSHLACFGLSHSTIKTYLSALRHLQVMNDFGDPMWASMPKLKLVERGIRRVGASTSGDKRIRLPVTPNILRQIKAVWAPKETEFETILHWAVCCTAFFGFFRLGELLEATTSSCAAVVVEDVAVDSVEQPRMVSVFLRRSKTDQFGTGVRVYLGATNQDLCPVGAMLSYLALRGQSSGPLFRCQDGSPLTKQGFVGKFRQALRSLGYEEDRYAGHSFRIGAATAAAAAGVEDSTIKLLGRWESDAFQRYIRTPRNELALLSVQLLGKKV